MHIFNILTDKLVTPALALSEVTFLSIIVRLGLSVFLGGIIGLERGANKHAAGFRTHILVCLGATLAMMTSQYVTDFLDATSDPTRLGAQVISGIGFLGVGTIVMSGKTKIRGLTTAAGLWASATVGLAIGIGFYVGAIVTAAFIYIALAFFHKFENLVLKRSKFIDLYVEIDKSDRLENMLSAIKSTNAEIYDLTVSRGQGSDSPTSLYLSIKVTHGTTKLSLITALNVIEGVLMIEESQ